VEAKAKHKPPSAQAEQAITQTSSQPPVESAGQVSRSEPVLGDAAGLEAGLQSPQAEAEPQGPSEPAEVAKAAPAILPERQKTEGVIKPSDKPKQVSIRPSKGRLMRRQKQKGPHLRTSHSHVEAGGPAEHRCLP